MANYYTKFSFAIDLHSQEEYEWWQGLKESEPVDAVDILGLDEGSSMREDIVLLGGLGFIIQFDVIQGVPQQVHVFEDDSGDPEQAAVATQAFLEKFDRNDAIVFGVAYSCSKPRLDAFGGAAYVVTKDALNSIDAVHAAESMYL
jgi:hypothetical protein